MNLKESQSLVTQLEIQKFISLEANVLLMNILTASDLSNLRQLKHYSCVGICCS